MKSSNALLLILTGAAVGAVAGLLLAPDEGAETRKKLMKKAKKYKKAMEDKISDYRKKASDYTEEAVSS